MKKRILSMLLAIVMVVGLFPVTAGATTAEPVKTWEIGASESGKDAVVAKLYTNAADNTKYDLVISGTGEMDSTHGTSMPWTYNNSTYQEHIVSVTVESGVTNVESYAFKDCTALTSVTLGDTVTWIGSFAFYGCTALTSVTLGATVTEIWGYAFGGCTSLTAYTVDSENTAYSATDGILFSKDGTTLVSYPSNKSGDSYTVPDSVTKISSSAFCDVTNLTELTIPHTTTTIVGTIFYGKAFEGKITIKGHTGSAAEDYTEWDSDSTTFVSICSDGDDADTLCDVCGYDPAHAAHPVCGDNECSEHGNDVTFEPWTATDSLPTSGSYYLTVDVTLSAIYEPSGTVNLCLNGHTVSSTWNSNVIYVESGNTLNICDCTGTGKITSDHSAATINVKGTASLHSGTVENKNSNGRPGIALNSGSLTVTGGTVTSSNGSGIGVYGGTLILSGAPAISGATADFHMMGNDSAAITIDGSLNNVTPYSVQLIYYDELPSTIVSANATDYSGNFVAANSVKYGIYYDSTSQCVKLAKVEDVPEVHKHPICGDAECASHGSDVTYTAWDGTGDFPGGNVYLTNNVNHAITISSGEVNLCLNGHSITSSGESTITVSEGAVLNICDCSTGETGGKIANTFYSNGRGINNSGTVNIYGGTIEATGDRGYGINNSGIVNVYGGSVGGKLYSIDNEGSGKVNISGGSVNKDIDNSGDNGTVNVSGGSVKGSTYGIQNGKGTVSITGGSVSGEEAIYNPNGGRVTVSAGSVIGEYTGIYNGNSSTLSVSGGSVSGKERGISNYNATATISGGTVIGSSGYGIEHEGGGTLNLSGAPTITGTTADVYLNSAIITIGDGGLTYTSDKAISVKMSTPGIFTSGWMTNMGSAADNYGSYFTSANDGYTVQPDGAGELELAEKPSTFTVSVSANPTVGGTVTGAGTYEENTSVTVTATPATGYKFVNWTENGTEVSADATYTFTATTNRTLVANFEAKTQYTVTYTDGEANGAAFTTQTYNVYEGDATPAFNGTPTWVGHTFAGWNSSVAGTVTGDQTYVAQWTANQYEINYILDGGTINGDYPTTYTYGVGAQLPMNVTREGYTFKGWYTAATGGTGPIGSVGQQATGNKSYYAQWQINQYTITFNTDGGSAIAPITQDYGTAITAPANPQKTGYTFAGWDTVIPATMPAENLTITAQWTANQYTITYILDGGTINGDYPTTYTYGVGAQLPMNVTREGYTFKGWYTAATGGTGPIGSVGQQATGNKSYYAQWQINQYTITFDSNGGSAVPSITQDYNTAVVQPANPTKTGYVFASWYTSTDGGATLSATAYDFDTPVTGNLTLYAKWTPAQLTGTVSISTASGTYKVGETLTAEVTGSNNTGTLSYQWYRHTENSVLIEGATGSTYTITEDDIRWTIYCVVSSDVQIDTLESNRVGPVPLLTFAEGAITASGYNSVYDSQNHSITVAIPDGATVYYGTSANDCNSTAAPSYRDVGTYTVYYRVAKENYSNFIDSAVISIEPASPTVTWPTATAYVNDASVTLTGGSAAGVGTETSVAGSFALETVDLATAGTKTVKITFTPSSTNYKSVEKTDYTVTVSKRNVESVAEQTAIENAVYGTEQDALGLPTTVEITTSGNKKFTVPVTWSGYVATNLAAQTLTGTLDLSDYADELSATELKASIVVDLQEKNAQSFVFNDKTATYTGSAIANTLPDGLDGVASVSYTYVGIGQTDYEASSEAPVNAGTYQVTAAFTMQAGYAAVADKTANLTIEAKEIGLAWSELTSAELVYSGTAKVLTATATGLVDGDSCTVTVELVGDNINVGAFSYKATALSNENYKLPAEVSSPEYTITPKTLTITAEDKEAYVYSRQPELTYTVDGLVGNDALTTLPTLTTDANMNRVGTYTITASGADAGDNYSITYVNGTLTVKNYPYIPQPTYDVEIADDITGGEVSASKKIAYRGDTITITVDPDAGYELTALTVTDSRGNAVAVTKISDSKYTFKMPGYDVEIDAEFAKIDTTCPGDHTCPMYPYTDLDTGLWYHDGIHYCIEHGLMVGTGTNIFEPNTATSRAMIVTILWRLEGSPVVNYAMDFEDVAANQWYTEAIRWAASEKIVEGYGNGKFGANDAITREQMVTIMWRYAKYKGYDVSVGEDTNILSYDDAFDVAEWAIPAMQWACGEGLVKGIADGSKMNLAPQGSATRAQAAAILQRFIENVVNEG